ncbi:DUF3343 domain-containing protein [Halanaerobium salsuginis]|jgi:hypothetical protein|uniref:Putative Se/S carrier protein-like domain-containing protein n=1 Tax=Halanaerobium salsuginis TaxID=29563 RepID=A0A1I4FSK4_9FIRM|nr:DUF3343 domain-containing protein [Halanaerobium salsuginis]SFL19776.1 Protein of unknown function [Halanaerobium salsuginis]
MEEKQKYNLIIFNSTHQALAAEDLLLAANCKFNLVPILPEISADCGLAIRFQIEQTEILNLLKQAKIEMAGYYKVVKSGINKNITQLEI